MAHRIRGLGAGPVVRIRSGRPAAQHPIGAVATELLLWRTVSR
jgi:hypothetical protein